ncbi:hypothetical protein [Kibdelosporangium philippinense]|uniref:hypothetical protein n=1 Tax=Kibdelosporangium philippinense TaxID=211113 RepID=UPI003624418E
MINIVDLLKLFLLVDLVGLTWHNPNSLVLVEGPEIEIRPVAIRRLPSAIAQVNRRGGDA